MTKKLPLQTPPEQPLAIKNIENQYKYSPPNTPPRKVVTLRKKNAPPPATTPSHVYCFKIRYKSSKQPGEK